ncbi:trifolitoxin immunity protein [Devosia sp. Leaf420]|uniref:phosphotransferase n=1 Tax=Devosia sp. Leaf420 TaxID=1736374 RepID=UPI0007163F78|nr:phosphotransferase [Devosia sp. Leaf420]KQT48387.1 trifolitoxin immunity protein [Devosia sp. Leaf420]
MTKTSKTDEEIVLAGGGRSLVTRRGDVVFRQGAPWSKTVLALLRHLEECGFAEAPRVIGTGFDAAGREMLSFIEGASIHPGPWDDAALPLIGNTLRRLHDAAASFTVPENSVWHPWFGRNIGQPSVVGHCDTGAWNIMAEDRRPVGLIDWEVAGPVDPLVELAQAAWLNALLFDDDIAERQGLGSPEARARQVSMLLDGYELANAQRQGFVGLMIDFVVLNAANEAIECAVSPDMPAADAIAAITWRTRSAGWLVRHRAALEQVIER